MPCETTASWDNDQSLLLQGSEHDLETPTCGPSRTVPRKNIRKKKITPCRREGPSFEDLYTLTDQELGRGAYAVVKTAVNNQGREVAVKVIEKTVALDRNRIFKEVDMFYHIPRHENIVQFIEFFEAPDHFYMVYEKVEGGPLFEQLQNRQYFSENDASHVIRDIALALRHLHRHGVAHRDLKPENVLCSNRDTLCPVKVCDFDLGSGIRFSKTNSAHLVTPLLCSPVGSPDYMAPEVVDAFESDDVVVYDKRCDLWSLGVIMYMLLCGYPPFCGDCGRDCDWNKGGCCFLCKEMLYNNIRTESFKFPKNEWASISVEAKELINLLLKKKPEQRASAEQVLEHAWIKMEGSEVLLNTPEVIRRNDSALALSNMADSAINCQRMIMQFNLNSFEPDQDDFSLDSPSRSSLMQRRLGPSSE